MEAVTNAWETVSAACSALIAVRVQGEGGVDNELQELPSSTIARSFSLSTRGLLEFIFFMFSWSFDISPLKLVALHEFCSVFNPNDLRGVLTRSAGLVGGKRRWTRQSVSERGFVVLLPVELLTYPGLCIKGEFKSAATGKDPPLWGSSNASIVAAEDLMSASAAPESSDASFLLPVNVSKEETT